jgi:hypothetical protein
LSVFTVVIFAGVVQGLAAGAQAIGRRRAQEA